MKLKEKDRSPPCKVTFQSEGRHIFGGPPTHGGTTPQKSRVPMHLVMTLDTRDPLVPLQTEDGIMPPYLPLYYPLRYDMGGGEVQYEVVDEKNIRIISVSKLLDDEEYPFMESFPQKWFSLSPFTYEQYRALLISEQGSGMETSAEDWRIVKEEVDPWHLIQFGGAIFPIQGEIRWTCQNKNCDWKGMETRVETFCRLSATPTDDIEIFGEHGTDVEIYFSLCRMCGTIIAVNRCT
jgi:hypothetical protein